MHRNRRFLIHSILLAILATLLGGCSANKPAAPTQFSFWPQPPDPPRVQFLVSFQRSSDITGARSKFDEMVYGKEEDLPITSPYSLAMRDGKIYVCDVRGRGLIVMDLKSRLTRVICMSGPGELAKAVDIAIAPDGTKYVVNDSGSDIVVLDANDRFVRRIAHPDFNPKSVAVYGNELFVSDFKGQCVKVLDRNSGEVLRLIGSAGPDDGHFVRPLSVRMDKQGNVVVADVFKCRIQTFTRQGELINAHGEISDRPGDFVRPKHMGVDQNNFLYVVDAWFSNVQIFDEERKLLLHFGSQGKYAGAMMLPAGLYIDEDPADIALFNHYIHPAFQAARLVLVTNQQGPDKVAVYAQGHLKEGKTLADISAARAHVDTGTTELRNQGGPATTQPFRP